MLAVEATAVSWIVSCPARTEGERRTHLTVARVRPSPPTPTTVRGSEEPPNRCTIPSAPPNTAAFGPGSKRNTAELPRHDQELCYTRMQSTVRGNLAWMLRGRCLEGSGPRHPGSILHCTGGHHAGAGYVLHGTNSQNVFLKDDFFCPNTKRVFIFILKCICQYCPPPRFSMALMLFRSSR